MKERTLVILKPDAVRLNCIGSLIDCIEKQRMCIIKLEMIQATYDRCMAHYNKDDAWCEKYGQKKIDQGFASSNSALDAGREILKQMAEYFMSGPIVAMVVEGESAIEAMRDFIGPTEPAFAPQWTLRGAWGNDSFVLANSQNRALHNIAHASDSPEEVEREIAIWFPTHTHELRNWHPPKRFDRKI